MPFTPPEMLCVCAIQDERKRRGFSLRTHRHNDNSCDAIAARNYYVNVEELVRDFCGLLWFNELIDFSQHSGDSPFLVVIKEKSGKIEKLDVRMRNNTTLGIWGNLAVRAEQKSLKLCLQNCVQNKYAHSTRHQSQFFAIFRPNHSLDNLKCFSYLSYRCKQMKVNVYRRCWKFHIFTQFL